MTISKLRLTDIWKTGFIFQDIYYQASDEFRNYVDSLTTEELAEFIDNNLYTWSKSFESGIMTNLVIVTKTIADNTTLPVKN